MILGWVRILPYFVVSFLVRKFNADVIETKDLGTCRGWRVRQGEWIIWSQQNYDRMMDSRRKSEEYHRLHEEEAERKKFEELKKKFEVNKDV